jgi:hypothetical protein
MRLVANALATSLLIAGSAAPSFAQSGNSPIVTIFRGGTNATTATNSAGLAAPATSGVTIMTGMPMINATPQQTAELPTGPLAAGNGANVNAGFGAGAANSNGNSALGNAATGTRAGAGGATIAPPARGGGFARPSGGGRGGFGAK